MTALQRFALLVGLLLGAFLTPGLVVWAVLSFFRPGDPPQWVGITLGILAFLLFFLGGLAGAELGARLTGTTTISVKAGWVRRFLKHALGAVVGVLVGEGIFAVIVFFVFLDAWPEQGEPTTAEFVLLLISGSLLWTFGGLMIGIVLASPRNDPIQPKTTASPKTLGPLFFFLIWGFFVARFWVNQPGEIHLYVVNGAESDIVADADGVATQPVKPDGWTELTLKTKRTSVRVTHLANGTVSVHPVKRRGVFILNVGPHYSVGYDILKYVKNPKDAVHQMPRGLPGAGLSFNHPPDLWKEGLLQLENVGPYESFFDFDTPAPETIMGQGEVYKVKLWKRKKEPK